MLSSIRLALWTCSNFVMMSCQHGSTSLSKWICWVERNHRISPKKQISQANLCLTLSFLPLEPCSNSLVERGDIGCVATPCGELHYVAALTELLPKSVRRKKHLNNAFLKSLWCHSFFSSNLEMPPSSTKNNHRCHVHENNQLGSWSLPLLLLCPSVASQGINQRKLTGYAILKMTKNI